MSAFPARLPTLRSGDISVFFVAQFPVPSTMLDTQMVLNRHWVNVWVSVCIFGFYFITYKNISATKDGILYLLLYYHILNILHITHRRFSVNIY